MPGTNHHIDTSFIHELPLNMRPAAEDLLKHHPLKELLLMRRQGVSDLLRRSYLFINEFDWILIINCVLLTKISYFEINPQFNARQLDKLLEIAQDALDLPDSSPKTLYKFSEYRYPVFANVIKNIIILRQKKLKSA